MRPDLAAVAGEQLTGGLGLWYVARAVVVGEIDSAVEDFPLNLAAEESDLGDHGDGVTMGAPAADRTEEVDAVGDGADGDLDLLREGLGVDAFARSALEDDDVQAVFGGLGVDDLVGDAVGLDLAELGEGQGVPLGFLAGVEAGIRRGGEGRAKVEQPETSDDLAFRADGHAAEVSDDIAQTFDAERLEAFRHEGVRAALAADDVRHLELGGLAGRQLELHEGRILAADEGRVLRAVLHLEVPGAVLVVDHAVRVHDVHEHLGGRMRSDALQVGAEVVADVPDLMAGLTGRDEEFLALGGVAGLFDLGAELRDDVVLGRAAAGIQFGEDGSGALGDGFVRMTHELRDLHGAELHRGKRLGVESVKDEPRPLGTTDERGEQGGAERADRLREGGVEHLTHGGVPTGSQRAGGGYGDGFIGAGQGLGEGRTDFGGGVAKLDEHAGGGDLCFGRGLGVSEHGQETDRGGGELGLEAAIGEPERGDRGGGCTDVPILVGDQRTQGLTGRFEHSRSGHATSRQFTQDGRDDRLVGGFGGGRQDRDGIFTGQRGGERAGEIGASGVSRTGQNTREHGARVGGSGGGGGGLGPIIRQAGLRGEQQSAGGGFERRGTHGAQGGQADARFGVLQGLGVDGGRELAVSGLGDKEGVLADRGIRISAERMQEAVFETIKTLKGPESRDAGFGLGLATDHGHERTDGGGEQACVLVHEHAEGVEADDLVRVIERGDESGDVGLGEVRNRELRRGVMLDAVDTAEVVLAVRAHGGAGFAVQGTTGVVVRDDRGVEIEDVKRAVRAEGYVDRAEPMVRRAEPFPILDGHFTEEGRSVGDEFLEVDDVEDRLGDEDAVTVVLGPGAMLLDGHGTSRGVIADLVDLQQRSAIRQIGTQHGTTRIHGAESLGRRARGLGQDGLGDDGVLDRVAVGRLAVEELHLAGDFVAEAVAAL